MQVQKKREAFHVQIRKTIREKIFQQKRIPQKAIFLEQFDNPLTLFSELKGALPNHSDQHLMVWPTMIEVFKQYKVVQEQSLIYIIDDELDMKEHQLKEMLRYLLQLTNQLVVEYDKQILFDELIICLFLTESYEVMELICFCFFNLLQDFREMEQYLISCDIVTKLTNKFLDSGVIGDIEKLKPYFKLLSDLQSVGYYELNEVHRLFYRLSEQDAPEIVKYFFYFLCNCTNTSNKQIFDFVIDNRYIEWAVKLLLQKNRIQCSLYQFLLNMSMGKSNLVERGVLSAIQMHLGEDEYPQSLIYSILHNITIDDPISIYECGILTRVRHQFEVGFPNADYIVELLYFLVVAFQNAPEKTLKSLIKMNLVDCFTIYITDTEFVDMDLCNNIFRVLEAIFNKQSKSKLLDKLKSNSQFLIRIGQLGQENDKLEYILNYFYQ